jgi:hypothetical protein
MCCQRDGCLEWNVIVAHSVRNGAYPGHWVSRGGARTWPSRTSDLTLFDFFLWVTLKGILYQNVPATPGNMRKRIVDEFAGMDPQVIE